MTGDRRFDSPPPTARPSALAPPTSSPLGRNRRTIRSPVPAHGPSPFQPEPGPMVSPVDPKFAPSSSVAPIHARFSRLSSFGSESEEGSGSFGIDLARAQLGLDQPDFSSQTTSIDPHQQKSVSFSPWSTASRSSFYQSAFDCSPQLGRQTRFEFSPTRALTVGHLVDREPTSPQSSPPLSRPLPVSRRGSVLGSFLKRRPSSTSASTSSRAEPPLNRGSSPARSPLPSPAHTPTLDSPSAPRLSHFPFTHQGSNQLNPIDEMNLLGRGGSKPGKGEKDTGKEDGRKVGSATGSGPMAAAVEADRPQLRIADRFASTSSASQPTTSYKPLHPATSSSIPTPIRPTTAPIVSPPKPARHTQTFAAAFVAPTTQPLRVNKQALPSCAATQPSHHAPSKLNASPSKALPAAELTCGEESYERDSSEDLQHSSSASGSLPQTPNDEQTEWQPRKQASVSATSTRLSPGASSSAYSSPYSSPSRSNTYTPQTNSPFSPPISPSQSITTNGSGYNPMAAFFGSASPPPRSSSDHASPSAASPLTPVASPAAAAMRAEQQPSSTTRSSSSRIPQPPSMYSDEEDDPYREFSRPKPRALASVASVASSRSPPVSPSSVRSGSTLPPRMGSAQFARAEREGSTGPASPVSPISSRGLRSKNSFFVDAKTTPPAVGELPPVPVPRGVQRRVAAAVAAAEALQAEKPPQNEALASPPNQALRPALTPGTERQGAKTDSNEAASAATSTGRLQKRRPSDSEQASVSRIPISPAAKSSKTLPSVPVVPVESSAPVGTSTPPLRSRAMAQVAGAAAEGRRAPSVGNLRAAALAQSASRHQAAEPTAAAAVSVLTAVADSSVSVTTEGHLEDGELAVDAVVDDPPLAPRFEYALSLFTTTILAPLLAHLSYNDFRSLRVVSKTVFRAVEGSAREVVLQRFLGPYGYRTLNPIVAPGPVATRGAGSIVIHSTRPTQTELSARRRFGGSEAGYGSAFASTAKTAAAKADTNAAGGIALTLQDLHGFQAGVKIDVMVYAKMARDHAHHQLPADLARMARASTRAYNRVVLRLRAQSELGRDSSQPAFLFRSLPKATVPVYKAARAPMLRVWVPTAKGQSWMGDEEVVECEREVWRAGLWSLLSRGDLVHNVAVGDFANDGKLISDGKYLRDLDFTYDVVGHCPHWLDMLSFSPSYFHNLIASSSANPVFFLSLHPFAGQIRESLLLCTDKVQVSSPQGNYLVKRFMYRGAARVRAGTIIGSGGGAGGRGPGGIEVVSAGWAGQVVIETEGTTESAAMVLERVSLGCELESGLESWSDADGCLVLVAQCESKLPVPWVVLRDKSRPDCIWLR